MINLRWIDTWVQFLYVRCSQRRGMVTLDMSKRCVCAYNYYIIIECVHRSSGRWFNFASNIQWFNYGVDVKLWLSDVTSPKLSFDLCKLGMRFHITFFRCIISRGFMNTTCRQMAPLSHNSSWSHTRAATQKSLKCKTAYWNKFKESNNCRYNGNCEDIRKWISQSRLGADMYMSTYDFDVIDICYHLWSILTTPTL